MMMVQMIDADNFHENQRFSSKSFPLVMSIKSINRSNNTNNATRKKAIVATQLQRIETNRLEKAHNKYQQLRLHKHNNTTTIIQFSNINARSNQFRPIE